MTAGPPGAAPVPRRTLDKYLRVVRYALRHSPALAGIVALTVGLSLVAALSPWPLKLLVDYGLGGVGGGSASELAPTVAPALAPTLGPTLAPTIPPALAAGLAAVGVEPTPVALIWLAGLAVVALFAAGAALESALTWTWSAVGQRMVYDLAGDLFLHLQRLSPMFHAGRTVGDSITRITGDAWCVYTVTEGVLIAPPKHLLTLLAVGAVAWQLDPALTLLTFAITPLLALTATVFAGRLKGFERARLDARARVAALLQQVLGALPMVQTAGAGPRNLAAFTGLAGDGVGASRRTALANGGYDLVTGLLLTLGMAAVLYQGGQRVLEGALTVGSLLVFLAYFKTLDTAFRGLLSTFAALRAAEASIDRVLEILDTREAVPEAPHARPLPPREPGQSGALVFERIHFGYAPGRPVLRGIALAVAPGETIALVGTTGAGKSTLAALVPRFFDPWQGRVLLDGLDLRDLTLASLRRETALVLQEPFLLPISVADNIAYGRDDASREDIVAAAAAANAHEFIARLPAGYDTVLGEQGATLSGGQRQRLAIARALLKDARVLVLDEPTSALDPTTEGLVMEALGRLTRGRTTLIIAHRLSTVQRADRIAVLEDGRIVELGTYAELIARDGRFARLHRLQSLTADAPAAGDGHGRAPPEAAPA